MSSNSQEKFTTFLSIILSFKATNSQRTTKYARPSTILQHTPKQTPRSCHYQGLKGGGLLALHCASPAVGCTHSNRTQHVPAPAPPSCTCSSAAWGGAKVPFHGFTAASCHSINDAGVLSTKHTPGVASGRLWPARGYQSRKIAALYTLTGSDALYLPLFLLPSPL